MIDGTALSVSLGGLLFLWLAWRGIAKRKVIGNKGESKDTHSFSFYRIVIGYLLVGISLFGVGLFLFYQANGWAGPSLVVLIVGFLLFSVFQTDKWRTSFKDSVKKSFEKKEPPQIQANAKNWALATVAMISKSKGLDHESLAGKPLNNLITKAAQRKLKKAWDIEDEEDLENVLQWLMEQGHRHEFHDVIQRVGQMDAEDVEHYLNEIEAGKYGLETHEEQIEEKHRVAMVQENKYNIRFLSFMSWDYLRLIDLCRQGFVAGYIKEKDAWQRILSAAQVLQARYESWQDMGQHYLYAREFWSVVEMNKDGSMYQKAFKDLILQPDSPWNVLPWDLSLYKKPNKKMGDEGKMKATKQESKM